MKFTLAFGRLASELAKTDEAELEEKKSEASGVQLSFISSSVYSFNVSTAIFDPTNQGTSRWPVSHVAVSTEYHIRGARFAGKRQSEAYYQLIQKYTLRCFTSRLNNRKPYSRNFKRSFVGNV